MTTGGQFLQCGSGQGQLNGPTSVIVDLRDKMIVADHGNHIGS